ncbi:restriction endonuclease [Trichocoleus sp. FACHB-262]|uniref:restriction endonuclease n=1 Tax=Trichocoleus sp. FACHB-262 TaxID=2692869 RepID=UPI0016851436|nr:restriction endonuclease [Trichocoleus sp. FACHB-262]MBD2123334.1 restriction endonuclease [Trichocoleus sp. FACHB-262]
MFGYVLLCEDTFKATKLSREIYVENAVRNAIPIAPPPEKMFGVYENIVSGEVGLHVPLKYWAKLPDRFRSSRVHKTPFWVNQEFINGEPLFFIGNSPLGFGVGVNNPQETRKILEGNFAKPLLDEVRNSTRKYTIKVQERAERFIREVSDDPVVREKLLTQLDPILFEEVVAELLASKGFDVFLTSRTRDKGKDIYAAWPTPDGTILMMIECKRLQPNSALDAINVRALLGQFMFEQTYGSRVSCAMLATTARRLGAVACEYSEKVEDLTIKTYDDLSSWISSYGRSRDGLWVPTLFKDVL